MGAATDCKELCGAVLLLPSRSGVERGAGGSGDLLRDTGSSPTPCVSAPGVAVSWWKGRNPLLAQLCPPRGCCRAVPMLSSVPTSAGREAVESPSAVAMTAPSTAPSRCPSHRDSSAFPAPLALTSARSRGCRIPFPLPAQGGGLGSRKEACGSPMFPFPAGSGAPGPCASSPAPGARQVPVAAVTISMETGPAPLHPGDRGRGRRGDVSPSPRGHCIQAPKGSVKMEIPQVASVWRNPKETNWFSPPLL